MAKVLGLGGVFFKAKDPAALTAWYQQVLSFPTGDCGVMFPHPDVGFTLWSPFKVDTTYFEPSTNPYMINFLVDDIDGVIAAAAEQGVEPTGRQDESYGRFAWFVDPEGGKVEIWQPLEEASS